MNQNMLMLQIVISCILSMNLERNITHIHPLYFQQFEIQDEIICIQSAFIAKRQQEKGKLMENLTACKNENARLMMRIHHLHEKNAQLILMAEMTDGFTMLEERKLRRKNEELQRQNARIRSELNELKAQYEFQNEKSQRSDSNP